MQIDKNKIEQFNSKSLELHRQQFGFLAESLSKKVSDLNKLILKIQAFQVAIPSWALGAGGTRFGRFSYGGEPSNLEEKIEDVGLIHQLSQSAGAISLHIPWDVPQDPQAIQELAQAYNLVFDAVNSNTFQDQAQQDFSYKYGSLSHVQAEVRQQAIEHNQRVIDIGKALGSKSITVWLADGACFPGQINFQTALSNTLDSLKAIYQHLPEDWKMFIEYKPYEPSFYATVIQDWGTSFLLANHCGEKAYSLVDLGHHLPNANIEQIVSTLLWAGKLGGFHFNDSKYGDDDLTVGSIKPYQLFLIFQELVRGLENNHAGNPQPSWMIDASHNLKDPLEDLLQSLEAIRLAYAQALIVDQEALDNARANNDVVKSQEILQEAFRSDLRPLLAEARLKSGGAIDPIAFYRAFACRERLIEKRGIDARHSGL